MILIRYEQTERKRQTYWCQDSRGNLYPEHQWVTVLGGNHGHQHQIVKGDNLLAALINIEALGYHINDLGELYGYGHMNLMADADSSREYAVEVRAWVLYNEFKVDTYPAPRMSFIKMLPEERDETDGA